MCLFRRKHAPDLINEDRKLIEKMEATFNPILKKIDDKEIVEEINKLKNVIHYLNPSSNKKVIAYDQKIFDDIDDLNSEIIKDKLKKEKILEGLKNIDVSLASRGIKLI